MAGRAKDSKERVILASNLFFSRDRVWVNSDGSEQCMEHKKKKNLKTGRSALNVLNNKALSLHIRRLRCIHITYEANFVT